MSWEDTPLSGLLRDKIEVKSVLTIIFNQQLIYTGSLRWVVKVITHNLEESLVNSLVNKSQSDVRIVHLFIALDGASDLNQLLLYDFLSLGLSYTVSEDNNQVRQSLVLLLIVLKSFCE